MQAIGSDRVREGEGEQIILSSRISKGWNAGNGRIPGTAVLWEDRYFEVVGVEALPQGGVQYVLEPWAEHHAMRVTDRYDVESETLRIQEYRQALQREKGRKSASFGALFTGHLPAVVQEELGRELGILPARLTFISIIGVWVVIAAVVYLFVTVMMRHEGLSTPIAAVVLYLSVENVVRFLINWTQSRPIGSPIGFILYSLFHFITGRGPSPFAVEKGWSVKIGKPPDDVAREDAFKVREAFVTLLTPAEQSRVAQRFSYDYRRTSTSVAMTILLVAAVGIVSSYMRNAVLAFIVAAVLALEQIIRLASFRNGPAASMLRFFVRPFVRKLL